MDIIMDIAKYRKIAKSELVIESIIIINVFSCDQAA